MMRIWPVAQRVSKVITRSHHFFLGVSDWANSRTHLAVRHEYHITHSTPLRHGFKDPSVRNPRVRQNHSDALSTGGHLG